MSKILSSFCKNGLENKMKCDQELTQLKNADRLLIGRCSQSKNAVSFVSKFKPTGGISKKFGANAAAPSNWYSKGGISKTKNYQSKTQQPSSQQKHKRQPLGHQQQQQQQVGNHLVRDFLKSKDQRQCRLKGGYALEGNTMGNLEIEVQQITQKSNVLNKNLQKNCRGTTSCKSTQIANAEGPLQNILNDISKSILSINASVHHYEGETNSSAAKRKAARFAITNKKNVIRKALPFIKETGTTIISSADRVYVPERPAPPTNTGGAAKDLQPNLRLQASRVATTTTTTTTKKVYESQTHASQGPSVPIKTRKLITANNGDSNQRRALTARTKTATMKRLLKNEDSIRNAAHESETHLKCGRMLQIVGTSIVARPDSNNVQPLQYSYDFRQKTADRKNCPYCSHRIASKELRSLSSSKKFPTDSSNLFEHSHAINCNNICNPARGLAHATHPSERNLTQGSVSCTKTQCKPKTQNPMTLLVPSLFPYVPPFLAFSSNAHRGPSVPKELKRILRFRISNITPKVVRIILHNTGFTMTNIGMDWMGVWGRQLRSHLFKTIRAHQKINHLPGSFGIGRKDFLWRSLVKLMKIHGRRAFEFVPETYLYPAEHKRLKRDWSRFAASRAKWILKPPAKSCGSGIRIITSWEELPRRKNWIVQLYIERPMLINGNKFDLRLYVLVTSMDPLRIYVHRDGLARFATEKYSVEPDTLSVRYMHLTNYSINRHAVNYAKGSNSQPGHKWSLKALYEFLSDRGINVGYLRRAIHDIIVRTVIAGELNIVAQCHRNVICKYSTYELFGFDILLDENARPWLLEVNISPSLHTNTKLDMSVKAPLVQAVLNTALFNLPPNINHYVQVKMAKEMCLTVPVHQNKSPNIMQSAAGDEFSDIAVDPDFNICYDKRLYSQTLSEEEITKHSFFDPGILKERSKYVNEILKCLTPDDVRTLIRSEDELARSAPLERIFPTYTSHEYFKYFRKSRYYDCLLDAWEQCYGSDSAGRQKGITLLQKLCADKYHLMSNNAGVINPDINQA